MKRIRISKIYGSDLTWERFDLATDRIGWSKKKFIQQISHAHFGINRDYYATCALQDAAARNMDEVAFYQALYDGGSPDPNKNRLLLPYVSERPLFEPAPLSTVPDVVAGEENARKFNLIDFSDHYFVLMQVALIVDRGSMRQFVSRMLSHHFDTYWDKSYASQLALFEAKRFRLD